MNNNYNYNNGMTNQSMNYNNQSMSTYTTSSVTQTTTNQKMKNTNVVNIIGYLGAILLIIGSFLDFATLSITYKGEVYQSATVNYFITDGEPKDGLFICILAVGIIVMLLKKKNLKAFIYSVIAGGLVVSDYMSTPTHIEEMKSQYSYMFSNGFDVKCVYGPAFYICVAGIIALVIYFIINFKSLGNNQVSTNNNNNNNNYNNYNNYGNQTGYDPQAKFHQQTNNNMYQNVNNNGQYGFDATQSNNGNNINNF